MKKSALLLLFFVTTLSAYAQEFDVDLQIRPRYEYRHGYKTFFLEDQEPAQFISQRSRLGFSFKDEKIAAKVSLQNVSVWGEVFGNTVSGKNNVMFFEAYGEYFIDQSLKIRLGRQVLAYDNQRILGESNWGQQARSHDAALIYWKPALTTRLDFAVAYNSEAEQLIRTPFTANTYKSMQLAWYHRDFGASGLSFLAMNTGYENILAEDFVNVEYMQTFGPFFSFKKMKFYGDAAAYLQTGEKLNRDLLAWYAGVNLGYNINEKWSLGVGTEYLSGSSTTEMEDSHSFTPLFGTNHGFNGLMDYFYAGNHQNSVGLLDVFAKAGFSNGKFQLSAVPHLFYSAANIYNFQNEKMDSYLGTEVDLVAGYKVQNDLNISFGYSQIFGTKTLGFIKGAEGDGAQNWAWLMVSFQPRVFSYRPKTEIEPVR